MHRCAYQCFDAHADAFTHVVTIKERYDNGRHTLEMSYLRYADRQRAGSTHDATALGTERPPLSMHRCGHRRIATVTAYPPVARRGLGNVVDPLNVQKLPISQLTGYWYRRFPSWRPHIYRIATIVEVSEEGNVVIILRGWMLVFHPWIFPLFAAFCVGLLASSVPAIILFPLIIGQAVAGYKNYWLGWGYFALFCAIFGGIFHTF
jgi:hypothetical protein